MVKANSVQDGKPSAFSLVAFLAASSTVRILWNHLSWGTHTGIAFLSLRAEVKVHLSCTYKITEIHPDLLPNLLAIEMIIEMIITARTIGH